MHAAMPLATEFAPSERASTDDVRRQHEKFASLPFVRAFLDAVPNMSLVLNRERQIIFANRSFADFLKVANANDLLGRRGDEVIHGLPSEVLGRRPGEAIGCIRSRLTAGGCGTTPFCQTCGSVHAILNSQSRRALDVQECRIVTGDASGRMTALDLRIWAHPIDVEGDTFTVFSVIDISNEKRREALERIFFHDVLNTAAGVQGLADLMIHTGAGDPEIRKVASMLAESASQLVSEIAAQRMLSAAEAGDLEVSPHALHSLELLELTKHQFHSISLDKGVSVTVDASAEPCDLVSDPVLLRRVLANLVKNALEATERGGTVTLASRAEDDTVCFTVHNSAVMPQSVQNQVFMRSFSTKGVGRGLGTYSIKLISEQHLRGRVSFVSNAREGTRFAVRFPRVLAGVGV